MTTETIEDAPMAGYVLLEKAVREAYRGMDTALSAAVMDEKGWEVPALFTYTDPETGDRYAINVTARANLIERGVPRDE